MDLGASLSLIDRLIDNDPDQGRDPQLGENDVLRQVKLGLRRDLEGLLNARRPHSRWLAGKASLESTVAAFGLPDLSTEDFATAAVRERIRRLILQTIRAFEPRLQRVEVEANGDPTSAGVRFRITAALTLAAEEEPVSYDARLTPDDREFAVRLAR